MFTRLSERELNIVLGAFQLISYNANDPVIKEGDDGDCLYIVENGTLECSKKGVYSYTEREVENILTGRFVRRISVTI